MRKAALVLALFAVVSVHADKRRSVRHTSPQLPPMHVFWIAHPFTTFAPAVANYLESAPPGSIAPFVTGDEDFPFVVIHRVEADLTMQPGPYYTEVATECQAGRVVTAPDGTRVALLR